MKLDLNKYDALDLVALIENLPKLISNVEKSLTKKEKEVLDFMRYYAEGHASNINFKGPDKVAINSLLKKGLVFKPNNSDWYHLTISFLNDFKNVKSQLEKYIKDLG